MGFHTTRPRYIPDAINEVLLTLPETLLIVIVRGIFLFPAHSVR